LRAAGELIGRTLGLQTDRFGVRSLSVYGGQYLRNQRTHLKLKDTIRLQITGRRNQAQFYDF